VSLPICIWLRRNHGTAPHARGARAGPFGRVEWGAGKGRGLRLHAAAMASHHGAGSQRRQMKRIEVKLALPVVAPLLDVIKDMADGLRQNLAAPLGLGDLDAEFDAAWTSELLDAQNVDVQALLAMFNDEFFADGVIAFDEDNAEQIVRATAAVRLRLREQYLKTLGDEA